MTTPLGELGPDRFFADYWQREPCLIRQAVPGFEPGFDGDDLAGLACEGLAEARIVTGAWERADWTLAYGPFTEGRFEVLGPRDWTLLVQDVEKHYPPLQALLEQFAFLPTWRLDDLMVSFAAPGGSVGPHVDQYDVFLLQAGGRRQWRIARQYDPRLLPDCSLNVLAHFDPEQEWVLEPGDLLYLPPGVAHQGVALDAGLTFSIGLRAPSVADLLLALGEALADASDQGGRYADPGLEPARRPGEIDRDALRRFHHLIRDPLSDDGVLDELIAEFLSRFRQAHEPIPPPGAPSLEETLHVLRNGGGLLRHPWTRLNWIERDGQALLFAGGHAFRCSIALAASLCGSQPARPGPECLEPASLEALRGLLRSGHLLLEKG